MRTPKEGISFKLLSVFKISFYPHKNKSKNIVIHLMSAVDKSCVKLGFTYIATEAGWSSQYEGSDGRK